MDEEATQAMLQRMDDQLDDLLRQNSRVESPEREVHSNETVSDVESQDKAILDDLELRFSINSGTCSGCQLVHQKRRPLTERKDNPEDIVPKNSSSLLDDDTYENRSTSTLMSELKKNKATLLESCSDSCALEADYKIRSAVDSIRREASRVEAALAIDQIQTMRNELQSLTCLVQAQSDQIQHLKKELKAKDEKLAMMELERDLSNADLDALKAERDQIQQRTEELSNTTAKCGLPSRQSRSQKTAACSELIESLSSLSASSIDTDETNLEWDSPPKTITLDSVKSVRFSQKAQKEDRWIQGERSGIIQGHIGMAGKGTMTTAQGAITNHSLEGKLSRRSKLHDVSPTPHSRSLPPTAPKTLSQLAETEANYAQTRENVKSSSALQMVDLISNSPDNTRISRDGSPHVSNTNTRHEEPVPQSKKHRSCLCRPKILRSFSAISVSENRWLQMRGIERNGRHGHGRQYKTVPCRKPTYLLGDNIHLLSDFTTERSPLQSQVEELARRLKISTENSETLRKRLAMISSYYENTICRLQENIISLKKEMSDLEVHWVKQITSVEREKQRAIRISELVLQRQKKKIEATLTEDRAYL